jgi:ABC-type antimicrobial peptide transport system permease subunit
LISFARPTTKDERIDFGNGLRNYFRDENTLLFDVTTVVEDAGNTFFYLQLFYIIVGIVAMILSFFLILVSFVSNVKENSWELGVLRAVGLNKVM